jgi:hypothetical protein
MPDAVGVVAGWERRSERRTVVAPALRMKHRRPQRRCWTQLRVVVAAVVVVVVVFVVVVVVFVVVVVVVVVPAEAARIEAGRELPVRPALSPPSDAPVAAGCRD